MSWVSPWPLLYGVTKILWQAVRSLWVVTTSVSIRSRIAGTTQILMVGYYTCTPLCFVSTFLPFTCLLTKKKKKFLCCLLKHSDTWRSFCLAFFLSIHLSVCLFVYLSVHLSICLSHFRFTGHNFWTITDMELILITKWITYDKSFLQIIKALTL